MKFYRWIENGDGALRLGGSWAARADPLMPGHGERSRLQLLHVTTQLAQVRKSGSPRLYHF